MMQASWRVHPADPRRAGQLAGELDVDPLTAQLLLNRGLHRRSDAARFLRPSLSSMEDPARLPDLERAVERLRRAIARREPVLIFSDSDVDGLTASVILYELLRSQGAVVRARSSNRIADGYGLPRPFVQRLARSSIKLLILVDCGTNQPDDIRFLSDRGIETIIVDHHVPLEGWAQPLALINPHRAGANGRSQTASFGTPVAHPLGRPSGSRLAALPSPTPPYGGVPGLGRELCSAGLAFKVAQALLEGQNDRQLEAYLDVAALGTLADCAPFIGDNRAILAEGLARIIGTHRPGLRRLCEATKTSSPDPEHVVRRLAPRLNASGRLGDATAAWRLLLADQEGSLEDSLNAAASAHATTTRLRRQITAQAHEQVNRLHFKDQFVMVVSGIGWHQGLMGPLASQLAERFSRPAIAIAMGQAMGIGSGRSIPHVNLLEVLRTCRNLLVRFGGHAQACGLTVDRKNLEPLRAVVNHAVQRSLGDRGLTPVRVADLELPLEAVTPRWVGEAQRLAPFGRGNPRPTVILRRLVIDARSPRTATLSDGRTRMAGKGAFSDLAREGRYDVMASPSLVEGEPVLTVSEVKVSAPQAEPPSAESVPWALART